jgi:hypothetical protein
MGGSFMTFSVLRLKCFGAMDGGMSVEPQGELIADLPPRKRRPPGSLGDGGRRHRLAMNLGEDSPNGELLLAARKDLTDMLVVIPIMCRRS